MFSAEEVPEAVVAGAGAPRQLSRTRGRPACARGAKGRVREATQDVPVARRFRVPSILFIPSPFIVLQRLCAGKGIPLARNVDPGGGGGNISRD